MGWRALLNEMEPVDRNRGLVLLELLTSSDAWPKEGTFTDQLREFESRKELYEQAAGKPFDQDFAMAVLVRNAPAEFQTQLRLDVNSQSTYASIRERIVSYEMARRPWDVTSTAYVTGKGAGSTHPAASDASTAAPMDIGAVKGKGKEKGKFKKGGKPQWTSQWQPNPKKGIVCSKCGGRGHYATECPSEAGGQYQSPAGSQKGKDKGKDKGKGKKFQGTCSNCGAYGHKRADCWKRIAGVEEYDLPSVSGGCPSIIPPSTAAPSLSGFDERIRSVKSSIFAVRAFKVNEPELILIDSGADIHVCPLSFAGGVDSHEPVPLRDIGGKTLVSHGRKGIGLDIGGPLIVDFAVANVETAVLSVGQLSDKEIDFQVMNGKGSLVNRATGRVTPLVKFGKTFYLSRARSRIAAVGMAVNMDVEPAVGRDVSMAVNMVHYAGEGEHQRPEPAEGDHQRAEPTAQEVAHGGAPNPQRH